MFVIERWVDTQTVGGSSKHAKQGFTMDQLPKEFVDAITRLVKPLETLAAAHSLRVLFDHDAIEKMSKNLRLSLTSTMDI